MSKFSSDRVERIKLKPELLKTQLVKEKKSNE